MSSNPAEAAPLPSGISASALSSLFGAINGLRNRRALIAMMGCLVGGVLLAGLLTQMGAFMTFLGVLIWIVAAGTGVNAAGLLHMDDARGISPRSTVDALVHGLMCIPKLIALAILLFLVELAVFLVIAIVLFICKIPFLGPVLFTVAFPVSVVVAGITVLGLFLCMLLSLPAIWQGATIMRALSQTLAIARSRIVEAILLLAVVWLLAFVVALIVFGVLFAGLMPTLGLSASILGFGDLGSMMGGMGGMGGMRRHERHGWRWRRRPCRRRRPRPRRALGRSPRRWWRRSTCSVCAWSTCGSPKASTSAPPRRHCGKSSTRRAAAPAISARRRAPPPTAPPRRRRAAGGDAAAVLHPAGADAAALSTPPAWPPAAPPRRSRPRRRRPPCRRPTRRPRPTCRRRRLRHRPTSTCRSTTSRPPGDAAEQRHRPTRRPPTRRPAYVPPPAQPAAAPAMPAASTCPQCLSPVTGEDVFCGVCGYRLK